MEKVNWKTSGQYEDIKYETFDHIAKITINRPEAHNSMNVAINLTLIFMA